MPRARVSLQDGNLSFDQKRQIIEYRASNPNESLGNIAQWTKEKFHLLKASSKSYISRILKDKAKYEVLSKQDVNIRCIRHIKHDPLEEALVKWILQME
jgi:hypothetical protein